MEDAESGHSSSPVLPRYRPITTHTLMCNYHLYTGQLVRARSLGVLGLALLLLEDNVNDITDPILLVKCD